MVLQRLDGHAPDALFDVIIATNVLVYYDVFEQSLAVTNIAKMLRKTLIARQQPDKRMAI